MLLNGKSKACGELIFSVQSTLCSWLLHKMLSQKWTSCCTITEHIHQIKIFNILAFIRNIIGTLLIAVNYQLLAISLLKRKIIVHV